MCALIKKANNGYILALNKNLYRKELIDKAVDSEKSWIRMSVPTKSHFCLEMNTSEVKDVLEWANYLLYLDRDS